MPPLPAIADYELLHRLGGGPLTQVFAARRRSDHLPCAIKVPRDHWAMETDAIPALAREAAALESIRHANVVRLIEQHVDSDPRFLALEFLAGESLRERVERDAKLEPRMVLWFARQIAEGLQAVHQAGFVHGDVKPENVRVQSTGWAVLLDFGFAHRPNRAGASRPEGRCVGTPNYVAPELATAPHIADFAADWFSFGVMLWELLPKDGSPRLMELVSGLIEANPRARPKGPFVIHELIALEIAALSPRRAG